MSPMRGYSDSVRTYLITKYIETDQTYTLTEFPERPGALRKFLEGIQTEWNISLFHYRNHGSGKLYLVLLNLTLNKILNRQLPFLDLGKVLAGIQVPQEQYEKFDEFLEKLGYPYVEETNNEVYKRYLRGSA